MKYFALALMLLFVACNPGHDKMSDYNTETQKPARKVPRKEGATPAGVLELVLEADDQMRFDKNVLYAAPGQQVRLTLKHTGKLPLSSMGHNFVLLKQGVDRQAFAAKAASADQTDYIPTSDKGNIIAHTRMLGGGQTDVVEFVVPDAGEYPFLCSFPGHAGMMQGLFIVE